MGKPTNQNNVNVNVNIKMKGRDCMAKDRNGNKKSVVEMSIRWGDLVRKNYGRYMWWFEHRLDELADSREYRNNYGESYALSCINVELSEYDYTINESEIYKIGWRIL